MARAPYQVLVFPYREAGDAFEFALFKRADLGFWQGISGGGEDYELPLEAADREMWEETGIESEYDFIRLDTISSIPVTAFEVGDVWDDDTYVIPEYCFGFNAEGMTIRLSQEHTEFGWFVITDALGKVKFDGNRTALWELNQKLLGRGPRD